MRRERDEICLNFFRALFAENLTFALLGVLEEFLAEEDHRSRTHNPQSKSMTLTQYINAFFLAAPFNRCWKGQKFDDLVSNRSR